MMKHTNPHSIYSDLADAAMARFSGETVLDCAIGQHCVAIESQAGTGLAFNTEDAWQLTADAGGAKAVEMCFRGVSLDALIPQYPHGDPLAAVISLAAINSVLNDNSSHQKGDFVWSDILASRRLAMVGCFTPLLSVVYKSVQELIIFELEDLPDMHRPEEAPRLMPTCDAVIITAATFSNQTFHDYLPHISPGASVYIIGPTTPLADFLCNRFHLGGSLVVDTPLVLKKIRDDATYKSIQPWLQKVICPRKIP